MEKKALEREQGTASWGRKDLLRDFQTEKKLWKTKAMEFFNRHFQGEGAAKRSLGRTFIWEAAPSRGKRTREGAP